MSIEKVKWGELENFLPLNTIDFVNDLLSPYPIKLILTRPRLSLLGYYKPPFGDNKLHTITINQNLNAFSFFIVLLHEAAHMRAYLSYGNAIKAHGKEWQIHFSELLARALTIDCFPPGIYAILQKRIVSPASLRSCADPELMRELKKWDKSSSEHQDSTAVENIPIGGFFIDRKGRKMQVVQKRRTRFLCKQDGWAERYYLYPAAFEVKPTEK